MGKSHDALALMWKSEIEANKRCELFLREIKSKQVPVFEDNVRWPIRVRHVSFIDIASASKKVKTFTYLPAAS